MFVFNRRYLAFSIRSIAYKVFSKEACRKEDKTLSKWKKDCLANVTSADYLF